MKRRIPPLLGVAAGASVIAETRLLPLLSGEHEEAALALFPGFFVVVGVVGTLLLIGVARAMGWGFVEAREEEEDE